MGYEEKGETTTSALAKMVGATGGIVIDDTSIVTGDFFAIHAISDTVIDEVILDSALYTGSIDGLTIKAGDTVLIRFTSITLTSGECIVYKK